jgi:hypothetical protein
VETGARIVVVSEVEALGANAPSVTVVGPVPVRRALVAAKAVMATRMPAGLVVLMLLVEPMFPRWAMAIRTLWVDSRLVYRFPVLFLV